MKTAILHWAISGILLTASPHKTSRESEDKVEATTDAPEFLALLLIGSAQRFFFSTKGLYIIYKPDLYYLLPPDSKPTVAQQSSKLWTLLLPTKPYWLVRRMPKQSCKRGGSQKLKQVLVTARLLGKTCPTIQISSSHLHLQKMLGTLVDHGCIWRWGTALYLQN